MKKLFTLLLTLVATTALWAHDFEVDGIYYNTFEDKTKEVEVTYRESSYSYNKSSDSVTIPSTVTYDGITYSVTSIGGEAFHDCSKLTFITIPTSVTSIGDGAFDGCSKLTSITIPESVTSIGEMAFHGCTSLTSVTIPNSVTSIGGGAFDGCSSLTSITIPNSVTSIGGGAFDGCSGLTSITIPDSITSIGNHAFRFCSSLTSITIPNSVTTIGMGAFDGCSGLTSITIPESVTRIGDGAFKGCKGLTYLSIPGSVIYKMENTDTETGEIKYAIHKDGFRSILDCPNLKTLIVPADFFGYGTYYYNSNNDKYESDYQEIKTIDFVRLPASLESLTIHGEIPRLGWEFIERNRKTLKTIDLGAITEISIPEEIFRNYFSLETLVLPSQLEYIPYMAVAECVKLQTITIPATVTEIADRAFEDCRSLKSIIFEGENTPQGAPHRATAEGSALWRIGNWAFYNCHQLEHLTIPKGVTEVGDAAFYGCAHLKDMTKD